MQGLGLFPCGLAPLGFGAPEAATEYAKEFKSLGARELDPFTKDYAFDAETGGFKQTSAVNHAVVAALSSRKGSSTVLRNFGIDPPRYIDSTYRRSLEFAIRDALRELTDVVKVARIESIDIAAHSAGADVVVIYRNLMNGREERATL